MINWSWNGKGIIAKTKTIQQQFKFRNKHQTLNHQKIIFLYYISSACLRVCLLLFVYIPTLYQRPLWRHTKLERSSEERRPTLSCLAKRAWPACACFRVVFIFFILLNINIPGCIFVDRVCAKGRQNKQILS